MIIDILIQINESRELLLKYSFMMGCPELVLFMIRLREFKHATNGAQEKLFISLVNDFLLNDSIYELNLSYQQKRSIHAYNIEEFNIIENEVSKMIIQTLIPTFDEFIKKEYNKLKISPTPSHRRPSIIDVFKY